MKTCPICGAGAFDDAEVCYGCLYRYQKEVQKQESQKREITSSMVAQQSVASMQQKPTMQQSVANTQQKPTMQQKPSDALAKKGKSETKEAGVLGEMEIDKAQLPQAKNHVGHNKISGSSLCKISLDETACNKVEWAMRFEFPGFVPVVCEEQKGNTNMTVQLLPQTQDCALLQRNIGLKAKEPCGIIIIQFQLESSHILERQDTGQFVRGSHARAFAAHTNMPVS